MYHLLLILGYLFFFPENKIDNRHALHHGNGNQHHVFKIQFSAFNTNPIKQAHLQKNDTLEFFHDIIAENYKGYTLFEYATGNLDTDTTLDVILILEFVCDPISPNEKCRKTVFVTSIDHLITYTIRAENNFIIQCSDCGGAGVGDPHRGLTLSNGKIRFMSLYGSCSKTSVAIEFIHNTIYDDWLLTTIETISYDCNLQDEEDGTKTVDQKEIITETLRFEDFNGEYFNF